jgi:hypothetical protein
MAAAVFGWITWMIRPVEFEALGGDGSSEAAMTQPTGRKVPSEEA